MMTNQLPERLPEETIYLTAPPVSGVVLPHDETDDLPPKRQGCSGCAWGIGGALGCLLLIIAPIIGLLLAGTITLNGLFSSVGNVFGARPAVANVVTSQTILTGIQPMSQLTTIRVQLAKADIEIGVQQGPLNACGFKANHVAQGTIQAGVDLNQISASDIVYNATADTYTIFLPPPQLTFCSIDYSRQYEGTVTVCLVDWNDLEGLAKYVALTDFREQALASGILESARQEAGIAVRSFVEAVTQGRANIEFKQAEGASPMDASCNLPPPLGWVKDETTGAWIQTP